MIENQARVDLLNWEIPVMVYIFTIFSVVKTAKTALGISYIIMNIGSTHVSSWDNLCLISSFLFEFQLYFSTDKRFGMQLCGAA